MSDTVAASIIIPTKDRPQLLKRALESALNQSRRDIEVIVVDDGSTPRVTLDTTDPRVRLVRHEVATGSCAARNTGVEVASGRFVTFLDDDDELTPTMIENALETVKSSTMPRPVAVLPALEHVDGDGRVLSCRVPVSCRRGEYTFMLNRQATTVIGNGIVIPTQEFREIGGWDANIPMHDDLFFRLLPICSIEATEDVGYRMTKHPGERMTRNKSAMATWLQRTEEKHRALMTEFPREHALYLSTTGAQYFWAGEWRKSVRSGWRAVRTDPRAPGVTRRFARSLIGVHVLRAVARAVPRPGSRRPKT